MRIIYIAGPFRANNAWEIEQNVRAAEEAALEVWKLGAAAICPHANTRFYQGVLPDKAWLDGDLEILRRCDAVYAIAGWERSSGAKVEVDEAWSKDIPVFQSLACLGDWLEGR